MPFRDDLQHLLEGIDLPPGRMRQLMQELLRGDYSDVQAGALLVALRAKGESHEEIVAAVSVLRELMLPVPIADGRHLIDTCGTGGDASGTFNISTAVAVVCAAAGAKVAKHGNRAVSGVSGSADVLRLAGVELDLAPEQIAACIDQVGMGFMFAPNHHAAMRFVAPVRQQLGVRTMFNLLGPLLNPASVKRQVLGTWAAGLLRPLAEVLRALGSEHVLLVHADDGLDELSIAAATTVVELKDGNISEYKLQPEDVSLQRQPLQSLQVKDAAQSLALLRAVLAGEPGPARDIVLLNAGAALYVAGISDNPSAGVKLAAATIDSSAAATTMEQLVALSQRMKSA